MLVVAVCICVFREFAFGVLRSYLRVSVRCICLAGMPGFYQVMVLVGLRVFPLHSLVRDAGY